jgi:hypothetical protein
LGGVILLTKLGAGANRKWDGGFGFGGLVGGSPRRRHSWGEVWMSVVDRLSRGVCRRSQGGHWCLRAVRG